MEGDRGFRVVIGGLALDGAGHLSYPNERHGLLRDGGLVHPDGRRPDAGIRSMSPRELLVGSAFQARRGGRRQLAGLDRMGAVCVVGVRGHAG